MSSEEQISTIILDLLKRNPNINIPGIGCLQVKQIQQYLGSGKGLILPPTDRLLLGATKTNAPDLFDLIEHDEALTKKERKNLVKVIQRILNDALNYGESPLGKLGTLRKSGKGGLVLDSTPEAVNRSSQFLPVLSIEPLSTGDALSPVVENQKINPKKSKSGSSRSNQTAAGEKPWTSYIFPVLFIIAVTILAIFLLRRAFNNGKVMSQVETRMVSPLSGKSVFFPRDSSRIFSNTLMTKYQNVLTEEAIENGCVIVVGSFNQIGNADTQSEKLREMGFRVHRSETRPIRIGIVFDCTRYDLLEYHRDIRQRVSEDAWFLIPPIINPDQLQPRSTLD